MFSGWFTSTTTYEIGSYRVIEEEKISEGGYAYVYRVRDSTTGQKYGLKKILLHDEQQQQMLEGEIRIWKKLGDHPNIVKMYESAILREGDSKYLLILMELCTGGHLINLMEKFNGELNEKQILYVLKDVAAGIRHMHSMKPPVAHRDIKVENILLEGKKFKLCDFGSATIETLDYNTASKAKMFEQMEGFERFTTLMYRPPEMIDQFFKLPVSEKVDIWMFGCVVYSLCYYKHPFQDAQKLGIVNAYYNFPDDLKNRISEKMKDFVRLLLTPDPRQRPTIMEVCTILDNWDKIATIKLSDEARKVKERQTKKSVPVKAQVEDRKYDRDLTPEDIARLQEKIRAEQAAKAKPYQKVGLIDWQSAGPSEPKGFFENEKKSAGTGAGKQNEPSFDYFNSDFF